MNRLAMYLCLFMLLVVASSQANHNGRKSYIVFMGALPPNMDYTSIIRRHYSLLRSVTGKSYTPDLIVTHYGKSFDGFAAWLTEEESKKFSAMPEVVSVIPDHVVQLTGVRDLGLKTQLLAPL